MWRRRRLCGYVEQQQQQQECFRATLIDDDVVVWHLKVWLSSERSNNSDFAGKQTDIKYHQDGTRV